MPNDGTMLDLDPLAPLGEQHRIVAKVATGLRFGRHHAAFDAHLIGIDPDYFSDERDSRDSTANTGSTITPTNVPGYRCDLAYWKIPRKRSRLRPGLYFFRAGW
jgi:hypothetical protein